MPKNEYAPSSFLSIDKKYKIELDKMKEEHEKDPNHLINVLEYKDIMLLAIAFALKNKLKPKKIEKKEWFSRISYFKSDDMCILKSLIYYYYKDVLILLPENNSKFYETAEGLTNVGLGKVIEYLNNPKDVENILLLEINKFNKSKKE